MSAGIERVEVAPYLDRSGVVIGLGPHEVKEARFHLWAEPLQDGIHYYLEERISADLGYRIGGGGSAGTRAWQKRVSVAIREFHGQQSGEVRLVAGVTVTSAAGDVLAAEEFAATVAQADAGYAALVASHVQLLDQLAAAITPLLR